MGALAPAFLETADSKHHDNAHCGTKDVMNRDQIIEPASENAQAATCRCRAAVAEHCRLIRLTKSSLLDVVDIRYDQKTALQLRIASHRYRAVVQAEEWSYCTE